MEDDTPETPAPEGAPSATSGEPPHEAAPPEPVADSFVAETESPVAESPVVEPPVAESPAGFDWGHLRGLQAVEAPAPEMAAREEYADELAKELSTRAARFVRSVDESIVLSSEGLLRWLGDPVARIVAGERLLAPRTVLLADDALGADERASAQARADLWLQAQVRKILGPLLALEEGVELPEGARALGARIAEALGVLERERVRNDVRALDQTTRGAFRKLGVRFGSLYIHVPQLLKPAPRALATQLWMLRRGAEAGAERLLGFASAGRTSFANDGALSPEAYRVAGFRLCGERVVRVDIVERLSDLIRAALPDSMRGGRGGGDAFGFAVTPQMTSLTGCSGEAFASILRSLGFEPAMVSKTAFEAARAKAPTEPLRPAPVEPAVEAAAGESDDARSEGKTAINVGETGSGDVAPVEALEPDSAPAGVESLEPFAAHVELETLEPHAAPVESESLEPFAAHAEIESLEQHATQAEAPTPPADEAESPPEGVVEESQAADESLESEKVEAPGVEAAASETAPVPEEEIEVWRPAPRRPRAPQRPTRTERPTPEAHQRRPQRPPDAARAPETVAAEAPAAETPRPPRRRNEPPRREDGKGEGRNRDERRDERRDFPPRREARPVDPDSPFAKLAALKPLLERRDKRN